MKIQFQKKPGQPALGIEFFWKLEIWADGGQEVRDFFIPELYFDFLYAGRGCIRRIGRDGNAGRKLPAQCLKTLFTHPFEWSYRLPTLLYGARLSLRFAERYWDLPLAANTFLEAAWLPEQPADLDGFVEMVAEHVRSNRVANLRQDLLRDGLEETEFLAAYSPRQKRRLYRRTFGLSRRELLRIRSVHNFLEENCDFGARRPRLAAHVDPEVFYDQPHMNRVFRQMTGLSPLEYFQVSTVLQDNLMTASYNA